MTSSQKREMQTSVMPTIRDYLIRVRKMKAEVVDAALEVSRDAFEKLPDAFKNMKGGIRAGEALYKKVENFRKKLERRNASQHLQDRC